MLDCQAMVTTPPTTTVVVVPTEAALAAMVDRRTEAMVDMDTVELLRSNDEGAAAAAIIFSPEMVDSGLSTRCNSFA